MDALIIIFGLALIWLGASALGMFAYMHFRVNYTKTGRARYAAGKRFGDL